MKTAGPKPAAAKLARPHRLRRLSEEEIDLWLTVAAGVAPRPGSALPVRRVAAPAPTFEAPSPPPPMPAPVAVARALPPLAPLERKLKQKLSRGRTTADAALDLHGLRQDEALASLRRFLAGAQAEGCRVVLVVTGKGGRVAPESGVSSSGATGVLRRLVPFWLSAPDFRALVVGFEEAARSHGGAGALYVRLRRRHG